MNKQILVAFALVAVVLGEASAEFVEVENGKELNKLLAAHEYNKKLLVVFYVVDCDLECPVLRRIESASRDQFLMIKVDVHKFKMNAKTFIDGDAPNVMIWRMGERKLELYKADDEKLVEALQNWIPNFNPPPAPVTKPDEFPHAPVIEFLDDEQKKPLPLPAPLSGKSKMSPLALPSAFRARTRQKSRRLTAPGKTLALLAPSQPLALIKP